MICLFTRTVTAELASLVSRIDDSLKTHQSKKLSAFLVLLTDRPAEAEQRLVRLADEQSLKSLPLTIFPDTTGPDGYELAFDIDVTILMWDGSYVQSNHSFATADLSEGNIQSVMDSINSMVEHTD